MFGSFKTARYSFVLPKSRVRFSKNTFSGTFMVFLITLNTLKKAVLCWSYKSMMKKTILSNEPYRLCRIQPKHGADGGLWS